MEVPQAMPDPVAFPGFPGCYPWSGTTQPANVADAEYLASVGGTLNNTPKTTPIHTLFVRGGV
jgi:hypothetical protein